MSTRAELLRDYLGVTPASAPGLYTSSFVGGQHGAARIKTRTVTIELTPEQEALVSRRVTGTHNGVSTHEEIIKVYVEDTPHADHP
jgi:hypothetical protein